jgi:hypothetical protein
MILQDLKHRIFDILLCLSLPRPRPLEGGAILQELGLRLGEGRLPLRQRGLSLGQGVACLL